MVETIYPPESVIAELREKLAQDHPDALIVLHPAFREWLLFERPKGSRWDARMLYEAMVEHHAAMQHADAYKPVTPKWVSDRGSPVLRDHLPRRPGWWLLPWLNQNDLWRYPGGAKKWLDEIEEEEAREQNASLQTIKDMNHELTKETTFPLHAADALRGDTIFRKWRQTNPVELKKEEEDVCPSSPLKVPISRPKPNSRKRNSGSP